MSISALDNNHEGNLEIRFSQFYGRMMGNEVGLLELIYSYIVDLFHTQHQQAPPVLIRYTDQRPPLDINRLMKNGFPNYLCSYHREHLLTFLRYWLVQYFDNQNCRSIDNTDKHNCKS